MTANTITRTREYSVRIGAQLGYLMGEGYMLDLSFRTTGSLSDFEVERLDMMAAAIDTIKRLRSEMAEPEVTR